MDIDPVKHVRGFLTGFLHEYLPYAVMRKNTPEMLLEWEAKILNKCREIEASTLPASSGLPAREHNIPNTLTSCRAAAVATGTSVPFSSRLPSLTSVAAWTPRSRRR